MTPLFVGRGRSDDDYQYYAHKRPDPKPAYDFTLNGSEWKAILLRSLRGKLVLIAFGFTHCPNICPTTLANLAKTYELLSPADRSRVQVLFISLDPDRDTSKVLKDYVPFFDKHFIGLTGQPDQIASTAKAYGVEYERANLNRASWRLDYYSIEHSNAVYLVGRSGKWIALYRDKQLRDSQRVADDLRPFSGLFPSLATTTGSPRKGELSKLNRSRVANSIWNNARPAILRTVAELRRSIRRSSDRVG